MKRVQQRLWVGLALIAAFVSLGAWALSSPIGSSPDDDYHNASIWCGQGFRDGLCEEGSEDGAVVVARTLIANSACFAFHPELSGACPRSSEPMETLRSNADGGYPPVFYWSMSWLAGDDLDASIIAMRLLNGGLAVALLALTISVLPRDQRRAPLAGILLTMMPLGLFVLSSVNPSSWTYVSLVTFFVSFVAFLREDVAPLRIRLILISGLSLLMGAGTRADAGIYIVLAIVLAWMLAFTRSRVTLQNVGASFVFAVASYLFYRGAGQAGYWNSGSEGSGVSSLGEFASNLVNFPLLVSGVFGTSGLGWLDTDMPSSVWVVGLTIASAVIFASVPNLSRIHGTALVGAFGALVAVPMYMLTINDTAVGASVQPRYLLPLVALVVAVALYRTDSVVGTKFSPVQMALVAGGLSIANLVALHTNTLRYVSGNDVRSVNLDENIDWWWSGLAVSPNGNWLIGSVAFAAMMVALWKLRAPLGLVDKNPAAA